MGERLSNYMRVKFTQMIATTNGIYHPGDVIEVSETRGKELVEKRVAVEHKGEDEVKLANPKESAVATTAAMPVSFPANPDAHPVQEHAVVETVTESAPATKKTVKTKAAD